MSETKHGRYINGSGVDSYKFLADALPVIRVGGGEYVRYRLGHDMQNPESRTWAFAGQVLGVAATDLIDGYFARRSLTRPDALGGFLDQVGDKLFFLRPTAKLVKNGELARRNFWVPAVRDVAANAIRYAGLKQDKRTDARDLGKYKMWAQTLALSAACSPLAHERPEAVQKLYDIATSFSVVSGVDTVQNLVDATGTITSILDKAQTIAATSNLNNPAELAQLILLTAADEVAPPLPMAA